MRVVILLADGFEEIEAISAIDILRRAKIDVVSASITDHLEVEGSHGLNVRADALFSDISGKDFRSVILPGGMRGVENLLQFEALGAFLTKHAEAGAVIAAICAAPLVLDKYHLLDINGYTCHPTVARRVTTPGRRFEAVVRSGRMLTSRSAGTAMAWSLELVKMLLGKAPDDLLRGLALS